MYLCEERRKKPASKSRASGCESTASATSRDVVVGQKWCKFCEEREGWRVGRCKEGLDGGGGGFVDGGWRCSENSAASSASSFALASRSLWRGAWTLAWKLHGFVHLCVAPPHGLAFFQPLECILGNGMGRSQLTGRPVRVWRRDEKKGERSTKGKRLWKGVLYRLPSARNSKIQSFLQTGDYAVTTDFAPTVQSKRKARKNSTRGTHSTEIIIVISGPLLIRFGYSILDQNSKCRCPKTPIARLPGLRWITKISIINTCSSAQKETAECSGCSVSNSLSILNTRFASC